MKISGYIKNSFVDYPARVSCAVFLAGCNFDCWYCHNYEQITGQANISESEVLDYLEKRKKLLDGVVISGGEPTLYPDLEKFIKKIKSLGFDIKLDTNGSRPQVLQNLLNKGLINYIAMDYKAPLKKYSSFTRAGIITGDIKQSLNIIKSSAVDYEFRTTFEPVLQKEDILCMAKELSPAKKYCLQQYVHRPEYCKRLGRDIKPHSKEYVLETFKKLKEVFKGQAILRGIE